MSDEIRWTEDPATWPSFWAFVKGDLFLTEDETHQELKCVSVKDYAGTKEQAFKILKAAAARKLYAAARELPEAPVVAWTKFVGEKTGYEWCYTIRAGLPPSLHALALAQMRDAVRDFEAMAASEGWLVPGALNGAPARRAVAAEVETEQVESEATSGNGRQVLETEFIKITAPKGTPRLEFWRPNRQYPEIYWALGIEAFLQIAPLLAGIGLTAEKLGKVGEQYTAPLRIEWEPSPKNPKWKDIVAVTPRQ